MIFKFLPRQNSSINENWWVYEEWAFPVWPPPPETYLWHKDTFVHVPCAERLGLFNHNNQAKYQGRIDCYFCEEKLPLLLFAEKIRRLA